MTDVPPLDTSVIGLFCYLKAADSITLKDCLSALQSYTAYGNYIDGTVRVWDSTATGGSSPYRSGDGGEGGYDPDYTGCTGDTYLDVPVRIRGDGWIMAWLRRTDDRSRVVWWGDEPRNLPTPPTYSTRIGRAIQIIMAAAGIAGFTWTDVLYYDYEYPDARRLWFFGKSQPGPTGWLYDNYAYYYVTVPGPAITVIKALMVWIDRAKSVAYTKTGPCWRQGKLNALSKYYNEYDLGASFNYVWIAGGGGSHPAAADITSELTPNEQHTFTLRIGINAPDGGTYYFTHKH
ncbi:MAG: hypothetical protein ACE5OO_01100 [Candidatus Bathyarchaeia archaeon]